MLTTRTIAGDPGIEILLARSCRLGERGIMVVDPSLDALIGKVSIGLWVLECFLEAGWTEVWNAMHEGMDTETTV